MARSNYQFKKRQKELARKKKKDQKRQNKINNTQSESSEAQTQVEKILKNPIQI